MRDSFFGHFDNLLIGSPDHVENCQLSVCIFRGLHRSQAKPDNPVRQWKHPSFRFLQLCVPMRILLNLEQRLLTSDFDQKIQQTP